MLQPSDKSDISPIAEETINFINWGSLKLGFLSAS
jgi:hypothetical protein